MSLFDSLLQLTQALSVLQEAVESIRQAALTDDKTPLGSALALQQTFSSTADESSFAIVIFGDLNRFKRLNDQYGHTAGDAAIRHVGTMIEDIFVKGYDALAFRQSGDEFVILLRREFLDSFKTATRNFAHCGFEFEGEQIETAMSFGYAVRQVEIDFDTLLKRADTACQAAKRTGDGSYIEWTDEIENESFVPLRNVPCPNCRTLITCDIPRQHSQHEINICPVCSTSLTSQPSYLQDPE